MTRNRKPRASEGKRVRSATKTEIEGRAAKAFRQRTEAVEERNAVVRHLMETRVLLAALVARDGRVVLSEQELIEVGDNGEWVSIREDGGAVVLEMMPPEGETASEGEQQPAPTGVSQLMRHGFRVIEHGGELRMGEASGRAEDDDEVGEPHMRVVDDDEDEEDEGA